MANPTTADRSHTSQETATRVAAAGAAAALALALALGDGVIVGNVEGDGLGEGAKYGS